MKFPEISDKEWVEVDTMRYLQAMSNEESRLVLHMREMHKYFLEKVEKKPEPLNAIDQFIKAHKEFLEEFIRRKESERLKK